MSSTAQLAERYDVFVFDLDGTLIDSKGDIAAAANRMLARFNHTTLSDEIIVQLVGSGVRQLVRDLFAASGNAGTEEEWALAHRFFMEDYGMHCTDLTQLYPHGETLIATLLRKGRKLAVLSNKPEILSIKILQTLNHHVHFYPIVGGDTFPTRKPSPEGLESIISTLKSRPERTLMVGDSTIDVETAKRAGTASLVLLGGFGKETDLCAREPTHVVRDFEELLRQL